MKRPITDEDLKKAIANFKDKIKGGVADKADPNDFDFKTLKKGVAEELEHTNDLDIALEIVMDHLVENPHEYDHLKEENLVDQCANLLQAILLENSDLAAEILSIEIDDTNFNEKVQIPVENPGILQIPSDKKFWEMPLDYYQKLVKKIGYAPVIKALTNLEIWNKNKDPKQSKQAKNIIKQLQKDYLTE